MYLHACKVLPAATINVNTDDLALSKGPIAVSRDLPKNNNIITPTPDKGL